MLGIKEAECTEPTQQPVKGFILHYPGTEGPSLRFAAAPQMHVRGGGQLCALRDGQEVPLRADSADAGGAGAGGAHEKPPPGSQKRRRWGGNHRNLLFKAGWESEWMAWLDLPPLWEC